MSNEPVIQDEAPLSGDYLISVAEQAKARIAAVLTIKQSVLMVTNPSDWVDQNGKPYLQASGSEKIANLFNISWQIEEPLYEEEAGGHFTYSYKGTFTLGGRTIQCIGTRSSKDAFFKKFERTSDGQRGSELPISAIDKGDVKKSALTNLLGNGITRILGIRNLTWDDLKEFANITQDQVPGVKYKSNKPKPPIQQPQSKSQSNGNTEEKNIKDKLWTLMFETEGGVVAQMQDHLAALTTFTDKDGNVHTGKQDISEVSDKMAAVAYGKLKRELGME